MKGIFRKRLPYPVSGVSWLLVTLQFLSLLYLSLSAPLLSGHLSSLILELAGIMMVMTGLIQLNWRSFSVFPEPRPDGQLETKGIYAIIRHPMYAGILLLSMILVFEFPSALRIFSLMILTSVFLIKIKKEERLLEKKYTAFTDWKKTSNRLIPFIW